MENKKYKVLFVEDEKMLADMYRDKFIEEGFDTFVAGSAEEGLVLAREEKPDLVVLDILLPRENGISFIQAQKKDPEISEIPVIVFSNYDDPEAKKMAFKLGIRDYLIKTDFTPRQIVEKVRSRLMESKPL